MTLAAAGTTIDFKLPENEITRIVQSIAEGYEESRDMVVVENLLGVCNSSGAAVIEKQGVEVALVRN
ncbi:MAG: hypothetical protein U9R25_02130 [Chloroflexota bacterium]|nr:hypothetical protein [Chloroflexota bacterium]